MENELIREYIEGVFDTAAAVSRWIGPSYIRCFVSDSKSFDADLKKYIRLSVPALTERQDMKLIDLLYEWLGREDGDGKLSADVEYLITKRTGDAVQIYELDKKALDAVEKSRAFPFYFIEDGYAVRFSRKSVLFVLGNNE